MPQSHLRFSSCHQAFIMHINAGELFILIFPYNRLTYTCQISKYRGWRVTGLLPWSALLFVSGFILRAIGAFGEWDNLGIFIASTVLLLVAPLVICISIPFSAPVQKSRASLTRTTIGPLMKLPTSLSSVAFYIISHIILPFIPAESLPPSSQSACLSKFSQRMAPP